MYNIANNGIVTLPAGDSMIAPLYLFLGDSNTRYTLDNFDKLYFAILKPHQPFNQGEVRKIFTREDINADGDIIINLKPEDTENLVPGTYYYEIKLQVIRDHKEYIDTVVPRRKFYII